MQIIPCPRYIEHVDEPAEEMEHRWGEWCHCIAPIQSQLGRWGEWGVKDAVNKRDKWTSHARWWKSKKKTTQIWIDCVHGVLHVCMYICIYIYITKNSQDRSRTLPGWILARGSIAVWYLVGGTTWISHISHLSFIYLRHANTHTHIHMYMYKLFM